MQLQKHSSNIFTYINILAINSDFPKALYTMHFVWSSFNHHFHCATIFIRA